MPHMIIEYSSNLRERLNLEQFMREVHDAAIQTGEFRIAALRTRASERSATGLEMGTRTMPSYTLCSEFAPGGARKQNVLLEKRYFQLSAITLHRFMTRVRSASPLKFKRLIPTIVF